ncbi:MAG: glycosyltransferase [Sphaerobacteraceae bacterium]|nr:MAG: glycosyltransferase [Sphaerobacteraceae bacterium]
MSGRSPNSVNVSLITTIFNEAASLPGLLASISRQTRPPDEIIVVDGGSTDDSLRILQEWQVRLPLMTIIAKGANISRGRNIALERANGEIVAVTDAGTVLDDRWLEHLIRPFEDRSQGIDVAAGFFVPDTQTDFEAALAATTLPDAVEIDPETFLPSSRSVAFRRSWFGAGMQYPEWLDYCEDVVFDLRMKRAGARFSFVPEATVSFRPRPDIGGFWKQYYRYARGDGKAGLFWKRHLIRYLTYLIVLPSLVLVRSPLWRLLVLAGSIAYLRRPVQRLWVRSDRSLARTVRLTPLTAFLRAAGDVAKMVGYPAGLIWRARIYGLRRDWRSIPEE